MRESEMLGGEVERRGGGLLYLRGRYPKKSLEREEICLGIKYGCALVHLQLHCEFFVLYTYVTCTLSGKDLNC